MTREGRSRDYRETDGPKRPLELVEANDGELYQWHAPGRVSRAKPLQKAPARKLIPAHWQKKTGRATTLIESFYHAFHGIWVGFKEERNVRIHFSAAAAVALMGLWLKLDMLSWLALALAIGLVITAEFLNTALEHLVDLSTRGQYHRSARYAKDTAAAAVLVASFVAVIVGCVVFLPRLLALMHV